MCYFYKFPTEQKEKVKQDRRKITSLYTADRGTSFSGPGNKHCRCHHRNCGKKRQGDPYSLFFRDIFRLIFYCRQTKQHQSRHQVSPHWIDPDIEPSKRSGKTAFKIKINVLQKCRDQYAHRIARIEQYIRDRITVQRIGILL